MSYKHLSLAERYYIEIEKKAGRPMNKIAQALERSQSTISRELKRNIGQRGGCIEEDLAPQEPVTRAEPDRHG